MNPIDIIVWVCVILFVVVAFVSVLNLLGIIRLPNSSHGNVLFKVLVIEVIVISVGVFANYISDFNGGGTTNKKEKPGAIEVIVPKTPATDNESPNCTFGSFQDGVCLPPKNATSVTDEMRMKLYQRCNLLHGSDEYTTNCCDHLTPEIAKNLKVCGN